MTPPPNAASAEPSWCEAKTQPKTTGARGAEVLAAQRQGGRHGGHPVQAVEDDERDHAGVQVGAEQRRQQEQREPAQPVVGQQQHAAGRTGR